MYPLLLFKSLPNRVSVTLFAVAVGALMSGCATLQDWRDENKGIQLASLKTAPGYRVSLLATDMPKARHMVMGAKGTLFVGSMAGNVYALTMNGSTVAQKRVVVKGLTDPSGVAFRDGTLYVADRTRIVRFNNITGTSSRAYDDPLLHEIALGPLRELNSLKTNRVLNSRLYGLVKGVYRFVRGGRP